MTENSGRNGQNSETAGPNKQRFYLVIDIGQRVIDIGYRYW